MRETPIDLEEVLVPEETWRSSSSSIHGMQLGAVSMMQLLLLTEVEGTPIEDIPEDMHGRPTEFDTFY